MTNKSRTFCFTDWEVDLAWWHTFIKRYKPQYVLCGREIAPTTGKEHFQGYMYFKNERSHNRIKKILEGRHVQMVKGTVDHNEIYCRKDGNVVLEHGIKPKQGQRTDMEALQTLIREGANEMDIFNEQPGNFIRYHRGIDRARNLFIEKRNWEMDVRIYWGKPGTGKTRAVYEEFEIDQIYEKMPGKWWDGYNGEKVVLIDDFDPNNCFDIVFDFYLKLLDRYPMRIEYKGGSTQFRSKIIIFTSNFNPIGWFTEKPNKSAFDRRISEVRPFWEK